MDQINPNTITIGAKVVYVPKHLANVPGGPPIDVDNLGVVTSINDTYIFVRYLGDQHSKATYPRDLYSLKDREDLAEMVPDLKMEIVIEFKTDKEMTEFIRDDDKMEALKMDAFERFGRHSAALNLIERRIEIMY